MTKIRRQLVVFVTLVLSMICMIWYRNGSYIKNHILVKSPMPNGYIASGDYDSQCAAADRDTGYKPAESLSFCEDETFWELYDVTGKVIERPVILSCDPGRKSWNVVMGPLRDPKPHGALWIYVPSPLSQPRILNSSVETNKAHRITLKNYPQNHDFHPLGIAIWPSHSGNSSNLYVINHARERSLVEQFLLDPSNPTQVEYVRTISHYSFLSPNSLALTSPDAFYMSDDHRMTCRVPTVGCQLGVIETILALPTGYVSHVALHPPASGRSSDAIAKYTLAKSSIPFANGVTISASGTEVAIAASSLSKVLFYERNPSTNELTHLKYAATVPFSPDNIKFCASLTNKGKEDLIAAGHPSASDIADVAANKTGACAPSWVVAIIRKDETEAKFTKQFDQDAPVSTNTRLSRDGDNWTLQTLFQSDGIEDKGGFGSSTTGLRDPDSGALYVTGLYAQKGVLICEPYLEME